MHFPLLLEHSLILVWIVRQRAGGLQFSHQDFPFCLSILSLETPVFWLLRGLTSEGF